MKKKLEAVIFDFDGVLVDSVELKTDAFAELYSCYGKEIQNQVIEYHLRNKGVSRFRKFHYYQTELLHEAADENIINMLAGKFAALVKHKVISADMIPGSREALEYLHDIVPMFIVSGTPEDELQEIISNRNMQKYFKEVYGSPANKTDSIKRILDDTGYDSEGCMMVGDALEDYKAAKNNYCDFLGVAYNATSELPKNVQILPDLKQLPQLLREKYNL